MEITSRIEEICGQLLELYKQNVENNGHYASGDLVNTASFVCKFNNNWFELYFKLADYWKYLENGRKAGKFPPISNIENWIIAKRIVPHTITDRVPTTKQLAFLIARGIAEHGTVGYKVLQKTIDSMESEQLINMICDELVLQLNNEINESINEI